MTPADTNARTRRAHQLTTEALLGEIDARRRQVYRLSAAGVQRAGLRDLKRDLRDLRRHLSDVTDTTRQTAVTP
ncbi:MAG: hypothetical protein ACJ747_05150 [Gaiellaceae bacterium]